MLLNVVYSSFPFSMYERKVYHFSGKVMEKIRSFMRIRKFYFLLSFPRERLVSFRGVLPCFLPSVWVFIFVQHSLSEIS